jgi:two-component system phosphate regulon sensor histidine kinase PhoR
MLSALDRVFAGRVGGMEGGGIRPMAAAVVAVALTAGADSAGLHPLAGAGAGLAAAAALCFVPWPWLDRARGRRLAEPPQPSPPTFRIDGFAADILAGLPLGLVLLDADGRVLLVNPAAQDIIERPAEGLMGTAVLRAPALAEAISAALKQGQRTSFDVTLLRAKERVIHATVGPVDAGSGLRGLPRAVILMEDRTRAARAEELRRDFVANASHELRTPLASISGFIETLQAHGRDDPEAAVRFLPIMAAQAERMRRLIDDLLSLNRIEINEHVQPRDSVNVLETVRETAAALQPVAQTAGVTLAIDLPETPVTIRGSHEELAQVFANLIENAIKYGAEGEVVSVRMASEKAPRPGRIGISVIDRGPGIAREHLPRLTERFYRVDNERSRARGGTGLGLAIAKHILNRHRGDLAISSTPGEGSCFTVWLPDLSASEQGTGRAA